MLPLYIMVLMYRKLTRCMLPAYICTFPLYIMSFPFLLVKELTWDMCSLIQNLSKNSIILPLNAPVPSIEVQDLFPPSFKFHHVSNVVSEGVLFPNRSDGLVICGAPVGSDFYIQDFAAINKIRSIRQFCNGLYNS